MEYLLLAFLPVFMMLVWFGRLWYKAEERAATLADALNAKQQQADKLIEENMELEDQLVGRVKELEAETQELRVSFKSVKEELNAKCVSLQHRLNDAVAEKGKALEREMDANALLKQANDHQAELLVKLQKVEREFEDERKRHGASRRERDEYFGRANELAKEAEDLRAKLQHAQDTVEKILEQFKTVRACCKQIQEAIKTEVPWVI